MQLSRERPLESDGLLYPMMVIAAIALIAFSVVGIASMAGWMPNGLMGRAAAANVNSSDDFASASRSGVTFQCAECGVIESIRQIEREIGGAARSKVVASVSI